MSLAKTAAKIVNMQFVDGGQQQRVDKTLNLIKNRVIKPIAGTSKEEAERPKDPPYLEKMQRKLRNL